MQQGIINCGRHAVHCIPRLVNFIPCKFVPLDCFHRFSHPPLPYLWQPPVYSLYLWACFLFCFVLGWGLFFVCFHFPHISEITWYWPFSVRLTAFSTTPLRSIVWSKLCPSMDPPHWPLPTNSQLKDRFYDLLYHCTSKAYVFTSGLCL